MDHFIFLCLVGGMITLPGMCSETFLLQYYGGIDFFLFFFGCFILNRATYTDCMVFCMPEEVVVRRYIAFTLRRPFMP